MAVFEYVGLDAAGKPIKGVIDADSAKAARARLRKQGMYPTDVSERKEGAIKGKGLNIEIDFSRYLQTVSVQDLSTMTSQMATLVGASVPMVEALSALIEQTENPKLKAALVDIREKVNEGATMAKAMRGHPSIFADLYINMVDAGEQSGALDVVLRRLEEYTMSQVRLRGKLVGALTYPIIMTAFSSILVLGLFTFVIPQVKRIFDSFGATLPLITRILFTTSNIVIGYWWLLGFVATVSTWLFVRYIRTPKGRTSWHRLMLRLPLFGRLNRLVAVSRFCRTLATLLASGVPVLTALSITRTVVGNDIVAAAVDSASRNIAEGQSIAVPLKASGEFPPLVTHMITIGEKTGELETMLSKVADAYDRDVDTTVEAFTSLMTPVLTILMGIVVGIIAAGILFPMLSLSSAIR